MAENFADPSGAVFLKRDDSGYAAILKNRDTNTPADYFLRHQEKQAALEAARKKKEQDAAEKPQPITEDYTPENRVITQVTNPDDIAELSNDITNAKTEGAMLTHSYKTGKMNDADYSTKWQQHQYGTKANTLGKITQAAKENTYRENLLKDMRLHPDDYADEDKKYVVEEFYKKPIGQREMKPIERLSDVKTIGYAGKNITTEDKTVEWIDPADGTKKTQKVKSISPYELENRVQQLKQDDSKMGRAMAKQYEAIKQTDEPINIPTGYKNGKETFTTKPANQVTKDEWYKAKIMNEVGAKLVTAQKTTVPNKEQKEIKKGGSYTYGGITHTFSERPSSPLKLSFRYPDGTLHVIEDTGTERVYNTSGGKKVESFKTENAIDPKTGNTAQIDSRVANATNEMVEKTVDGKKQWFLKVEVPASVSLTTTDAVTGNKKTTTAKTQQEYLVPEADVRGMVTAANKGTSMAAAAKALGVDVGIKDDTKSIVSKGKASGYKQGSTSYKFTQTYNGKTYGRNKATDNWSLIK